jgi:Ca2+-binding EF-hand superfamily protein
VSITEKWLRVHRNDQGLEAFLQPQHEIAFAKDLFKIWDENDSGKLDLEELTLPLVALGLVSDTSFVKKLMKSLSAK